MPFCLACGDRIDLEKTSTPGYDYLFHCPNLQGVILGIGLSRLEHLYIKQSQGSSSEPAETNLNKNKCKVTTVDDQVKSNNEVLHMSALPQLWWIDHSVKQRETHSWIAFTPAFLKFTHLQSLAVKWTPLYKAHLSM